MAVGQSDNHWRTGDRCVDGRGVNHGAAFSDSRRRRQINRRSVEGVSHLGDRCRRVRHQVLKVATGGVRDGDFDLAGIFINIIGRRIDAHAAGGRASRDGDHRAVAQGHSDRRAGRIGQGRGVQNLTTFGHFCGRRQAQAGVVFRVGNGGERWLAARGQLLEIAAGGAGDRSADGAAVVVDVVGRRFDGHAAGGLARFDGNDRAVAQGHGHRRAGRVGQGGGVGDLAAFDDGAGGTEAQAGIVDRVGDGGDGRRGARYQVLEVAAGSARDRGADSAAVVVDVIGRGVDVHGAGGFTGFDGDGRTVGQGHGDRRLRRVGQGRGVGDLATFSDTAGGGQGQASVVDRIGNGGDRRSRVRHQILEVATGSPGDGGADGAAIVVDVIGRRRNVHAAGGLAGIDGDGRTVGQGDGDWCLRRVGQGRGVSDLTAFGDGRARCQRDGGGVGGIGNGGDGRGWIRHQVFEVAASRAGNRGADGTAIVIDVVGRRRNVDAAGGVAGGDGDGRTVGQGDGDRRLRRVGQCRGVGDLATFSDGRAR